MVLILLFSLDLRLAEIILTACNYLVLEWVFYGCLKLLVSRHSVTSRYLIAKQLFDRFVRHSNGGLGDAPAFKSARTSP
jgi:hypothetical protein